ncbi:Autophagy protein 22 [Nowakowskiella sp. JEL0078]|nr:Autophagy protein 22 [Nowakowskiella sp. JEL0078]
MEQPTQRHPSQNLIDPSLAKSEELRTTLPSTKRERFAWCLYETALSATASVALSFVLPLLLNSIAFSSGSSYPITNLTSTSTLPTYTSLEPGWFHRGSCIQGNLSLPTEDLRHYDICVIEWGAGYIRHTTWALNVISVSVGIQALCFILLGPLADHGELRKLLLLAFCGIQGAAAILYVFDMGSDGYWVAGVLAVFLNVGIGVSGVFFNAFMKVLTEADPEVLDLKTDNFEARRKVIENVGNRISSLGSVYGGVGAAVFTLVAAGLMIWLGQPLGLRVSLFASGVWSLAFSIPFLLWVRPRPGPPLPPSENFLIFPIKNLFKTLVSIPKIPRTFVFLFCFYMYSDAYTTVTSVAVLFAQNELKVTNTQLVALVIIVPFAATFGTIVTMLIQQKWKLSAKSLVIFCLTTYTLMSIYGILGLIDGWPLGLKKIEELFVFASIHGFVIGPIQSYSRVIFSELIPPGRESEFFGLYEITNKGSSWVGPLVVGALNQSSGTLRFAYFFLAAMFCIPIPILVLLDITKGRMDASKQSKTDLFVESSFTSSRDMEMLSL